MARNKSDTPIDWKISDNKSFLEKSHLRKLMIQKVENPVILETHGGRGKLFRRCYSAIDIGIVFEKDAMKAEVLVRQRPNWAVYESDCVWALKNGVGSHLEINFIDCDPYGQAWQVLQAFFESDRPRADRVVLVVHDGIRNNLRWFGGHDYPFFESIIEKMGNIDLYRNYIRACEDMLTEIVDTAGYDVESFGGFYSKKDKNQTHFFAELTKRNPAQF